jgi:hypothetical protein
VTRENSKVISNFNGGESMASEKMDVLSNHILPSSESWVHDLTPKSNFPVRSRDTNSTPKRKSRLRYQHTT